MFKKISRGKSYLVFQILISDVISDRTFYHFNITRTYVCMYKKKLRKFVHFIKQINKEKILKFFYFTFFSSLRYVIGKIQNFHNILFDGVSNANI